MRKVKCSCVLKFIENRWRLIVIQISQSERKKNWNKFSKKIYLKDLKNLWKILFEVFCLKYQNVEKYKYISININV